MKRVLVISPHPDDDAIGCGGTLRRHVLSEDEVRVVFLTSGEQGGHGLSFPETERIREEEARMATGILGVAQVEFWHQPDGHVKATQLLITQLAQLCESWQPDFLYVPHGQEMHPDHRAANRLVRHALKLHSGQLEAPLIYEFEVWTPLQQMNYIVDISQQIETKIAAIQTHKSQCSVLRFDEAIRGLNRYRGEMHSWPGGDYAEVFKRMNL